MFSESFFEQNIIIAIFSDFCCFEIKPEMWDVLAKMRECGKYANCGTVDSYSMFRFLTCISEQYGRAFEIFHLNRVCQPMNLIVVRLRLRRWSQYISLFTSFSIE